MRGLQERRPVASLTAGDEPSGTTTGSPDRGARRTRLVLLIAAGVLVVDQLTKLWAVDALAGHPVELVGPVRLALTTNTGGAFGLGGDVVPFLALGALVLVVVMATRSQATRHLPVAIGAGLMLGGAFGNLVDRLVRSPGFLRGAVVDFVDLGFWPVFNVADAAITCGFVLLIWSVRPGRE